MRWYKRGGDPSENRRTKEYLGPRAQCSYPDCVEPSEGHGWCKPHYMLSRQVCKIYPRECNRCGRWYIGRRVISQFCSRDCKQRIRIEDGRQAAAGRKSYMKREWGMSPEDYHRMLAAQGGACAICGGFDPKGRGRFHVDHDHVTDKIRGLLCSECNILLGKAQDDPELLRRAVAYLEL